MKEGFQPVICTACTLNSKDRHCEWVFSGDLDPETQWVILGLRNEASTVVIYVAESCHRCRKEQN